MGQDGIFTIKNKTIGTAQHRQAHSSRVDEMQKIIAIIRTTANKLKCKHDTMCGNTSDVY